jgi:hypothetical protein
MSKALLMVGRPVARAADVVAHNRDRRRRIRQFHCVTRVTLPVADDAAASHFTSGPARRHHS